MYSQTSWIVMKKLKKKTDKQKQNGVVEVI